MVQLSKENLWTYSMRCLFSMFLIFRFRMTQCNATSIAMFQILSSKCQRVPIVPLRLRVSASSKYTFSSGGPLREHIFLRLKIKLD